MPLLVEVISKAELSSGFVVPIPTCENTFKEKRNKRQHIAKALTWGEVVLIIRDMFKKRDGLLFPIMLHEIYRIYKLLSNSLLIILQIIIFVILFSQFFMKAYHINI